MQALTHFSLPIKGLENGIHEYQFSVSDEFFKQFEDSLIKKGSFDLNLEVEKRSNHIEVEFDIEGSIETDCDRCNAKIDLPVEGIHKLIIKFSTEEISTDEEVWKVSFETESLDLSKAINEFVILSMPIVKTYDCEYDDPKPCNEKVKAYLEEDDEETDEDISDNPFADILKNIELN